jgi:hypothetical protein
MWYKRHYLVPLHGVSTAVLPLLKFQPSYIKGSDQGMILLLSRNFPGGGGWEKPWKTIRKSDVPAEIRTEHLPNTSLQHYLSTTRPVCSLAVVTIIFNIIVVIIIIIIIIIIIVLFCSHKTFEWDLFLYEYYIIILCNCFWSVCFQFLHSFTNKILYFQIFCVLW